MNIEQRLIQQILELNELIQRQEQDLKEHIQSPVLTMNKLLMLECLNANRDYLNSLKKRLNKIEPKDNVFKYER